jgi:hypothetical protein
LQHGRSWPFFYQLGHTKTFPPISNWVWEKALEQDGTFWNILFQTDENLRLPWFPQTLILKQVQEKPLALPFLCILLHSLSIENEKSLPEPETIFIMPLSADFD